MVRFQIQIIAFNKTDEIFVFNVHNPEAATQRCSKEKVFWKYAANFQESTHDEMRFQ